jgi:hypothetical protein
MARATKQQLEQRLREVGSLVADCLTLREIRAYVNAKTPWGRCVSDATLKYYIRRSRALMRAAASFDFAEELGIARCRLERIVARAAAKGDLRTQLAATRELDELLGLRSPRPQQLIDVEAARRQLIAEIAQEMTRREGSDD